MTTFSLTDQWVEVFRAGDYGDKGKYTAQDLAALSTSYKADNAPIVIGHPKLNAPAFGWVEQLKADGPTLLAKFHQVNPNFEAAVKAGSYKKRSVAIARGSDGALRLNHVGFLGAMPPEVKGLADVQFAGQEFTEIDFSEKEEEQMEVVDKKSILEALKEFFGKDTPKVFTEAEVTAQIAAATKPLQDKLNDFADTGKCAKCDAGVTKGDKYCANCGTKVGKLSEFADRAKAKIVALKDGGKWLPAFDAMKLPEIFSALASVEQVITFGEGDKAASKPVLDVFTEFMQGLPKLVPGGKLVAPTTTTAKTVKFNATPGVELEQDSVLFDEACAKRASEKKITYGQAMTELNSEGWKPAGSTTTGAV